MRAVVQRVLNARVCVDERTVGAIGPGLLILLGIEAGDQDADVDYMVSKCRGLRIFSDGDGKFNHDVGDVGGSILLVSQFTLLGDCRKGRRPSFSQAYPAEGAEVVFDEVVAAFVKTGIPVQTGQYRSHMLVESVNDGPVTLMLDSRKKL